MIRILIISCIIINGFTSCFNLTSIPRSSIIKTLSNANKTMKVYLLENNGDATVDNSLQVLVKKFNYNVTGSELGNTFIVDRNHGATDLNINSINFTWISNDTLQIQFDKKLRTFLKATKIEDIAVVYLER